MFDCICFIFLTKKHWNVLEMYLVFFFRLFHDLSVQLLNELYQTNEDTTYQLVVQHMGNWRHESCFRVMNLLDLRSNPGNSELITHSSFQAALNTFWNGDLDTANIQHYLWLVSTVYIYF